MNITSRVERIPLSGAPPVGTATYTFNVQVDENACTGCGICAIECPSRIFKLAQRALPCEHESACMNICAIGNDMRAALRVLSESGSFEEAWGIITMTNPMPAVTGRVCPHACETKCNRSHLDDAVNVNQIERFLGDYGLAKNLAFKKDREQGKGRIAVVGSGPSGMSCACHLAKAGYKVTVFEAGEKAGGMLRYGIPKYRLPEEVLDKELQRIIDLGVEMRLNARLGKDIELGALRKDYQAVYLAVGAQDSMFPGIEGEKAPNSFAGLEFLRSIAEGKTVDVGKKVIVIGGGNVAVDVARSASRSGVQTVTLVCIEQRYEMPAWDSEIEEAANEGVRIVNGYGPCEFIRRNDLVSEVVFKRCTSVFDANGRFSPVYDDNDRIRIDTDGIIIAIGQKPDSSFLSGSGALNISRGYIDIANRQTLATGLEGVFAGGDITDIQGSGTVSGAIGLGRAAALAIDSYLTGKPPGAENRVAMRCDGIFPDDKYDRKLNRNEAGVLPLEKRFLSRNEEVSMQLDKDQVINEAKRCLACGLGAASYIGPQSSEIFNIACNNCHRCVSVCPEKAISFNYYTRKENETWK